ncbi:MAG: helix-turn-helix transcriptional regulator [Steroidobacteraceae bacterium]
MAKIDSDATACARRERVQDGEQRGGQNNESTSAALWSRPTGPVRMLRLKQVMEKTELGKTTIYKLQKQGCFPRSVPMMNRSVRWIESEIEEYLASRARARDQRGI